MLPASIDCRRLLAVASIFLAAGTETTESAATGNSEAANAFTCQQLRSNNQTRILCHARVTLDGLQKAKQKQNSKDGAVCHKIYKLAERLQAFEGGQFRYCDPARCLRESPHCRKGELTPQCNLCLGKCWLMYGYPEEMIGGQLQYKTFLCDPTVCGKEAFCGGYDVTLEGAGEGRTKSI